MSIDHDKLLALVDRMERHAERLPAEAAKMLRHYIAALRSLAQPAEALTVVEAVDLGAVMDYSFAPAEAVEGGLGRFGHHPDPATDFEGEVESLQGRLFNARHGIAKMGEQPETVGAVTDAIERAMRFKVGGDPGAVYAKSLLRALEQEAKPTDAAQGAVARVGRRSDPDQGTYLVAEWLGPLPEPGELLFTHPQAAPAQGDGTVQATDGLGGLYSIEYVGPHTIQLTPVDAAAPSPEPHND